MKVSLFNLSPGIGKPGRETGRPKAEGRSPNCSALVEVKEQPGAQWADFGFRPLTLGLRPPAGERGIALVITLIMLAVITFMAIAFLVLSRGERTSTATATDQTIARLAANTALERAQVEVVTPMIASGNFASGGLMVSTNFINPLGFIRSGNPQVYNNAT